jgi:hypothetical protein
MPDPEREAFARMELRFLGATGAWELLAFCAIVGRCIVYVGTNHDCGLIVVEGLEVGEKRLAVCRKN